MNELYLGIFLIFFLLSPSTLSVFSLSSPDVAVMQSPKANLGNPESLNWTDPDPCEWSHITCLNNRVTQIHINNQNLTGSLPPDLKNLSLLAVLHVKGNFQSGPIPSLLRLSSLQYVSSSNNQFTSIPTDFFSGLTSLKSITLDFNPFCSWQIPESLKDATELQTFSANMANISGSLPDFLREDNFPRLRNLQLTGNNIEGPIPSSFRESPIEKLWLNGQTSDAKLIGSLEVLQNMTSLIQIRLDFNHFTGPLPDFSRFTSLEELSLRSNELTGIVPLSLVNLPNITFVSLGNNFFQGPSPKFNTSRVKVDMTPGSTNSFCLGDPGVSFDSRTNILLSIVESMGYPLVFAKRWSGNDPCDVSQPWRGIFCNEVGNITALNFKNLELQGTISSGFSKLTSIENLILSNNALTGTIPNELTSLPNLKMLDVSNNHLSGEAPKFRQNVIVKSDGNPNIVRNNSYPGAPQDNSGGQNQRKVKR